MKFRLLFLLLLLNVSLMAQQKTGLTPDFHLSQTSAVSSGEDLPFWMTSNSGSQCNIVDITCYTVLLICTV